MENYKQVKRVQAVIVSCMLLLFTVVIVSVFSFISLGKARREEAKYNQMIASLQSEKQQILEDINRVTSSDYQEEIIRNEMGMIKEGETLYIFK